jgi:hypothetical protein
MIVALTQGVTDMIWLVARPCNLALFVLVLDKSGIALIVGQLRRMSALLRS